MNKTYKMSVRVKGATQIFADGMEPGEIGYQEIEYKNLKESDIGSTQLALDILNKQKAMIDEMTEVIITEV